MWRKVVNYSLVALLILCLCAIVLSEGRAQTGCYTQTYFNSDGSIRICQVCNWPTGQTITCW